MRKTAMEKEVPLNPEDGLRISTVEMEAGLPQKPERKRQLLKRIASPFQRVFNLRGDPNDPKQSPWLKLFRRALYLLSSAIVLAVIAVVFVNNRSLYG